MFKCTLEFPANSEAIFRGLGTAFSQIATELEAQKDPAKVAKIKEFMDSLKPKQVVLNESLDAGVNATEEIVEDFVDPGASTEGGLFGEEPTKEETEPQIDKATGEVKLDHSGVPYNEAMCSSGKQPFFTTGKETGQWKKKRGVDEAVFKAWYTVQLADIAGNPQTTTATTETTPSAAAAFGDTPKGDGPEINNLGSLMTWVSEMQGAGMLTHDQVDQAYATCGTSLVDVGQNDHKAVEVFTILKAQIK